MRVALGIDIGTTSVKTAVIDESGECLGFDVREYDLIQPAPGVVEADPREYWECLPEAIGKVMRQGDVTADDVAGVALSSQGSDVPVRGCAGPTDAQRHGLAGRPGHRRGAPVRSALWPRPILSAFWNSRGGARFHVEHAPVAARA